MANFEVRVGPVNGDSGISTIADAVAECEANYNNATDDICDIILTDDALYTASAVDLNNIITTPSASQYVRLRAATLAQDGISNECKGEVQNARVDGGGLGASTMFANIPSWTHVKDIAFPDGSTNNAASVFSLTSAQTDITWEKCAFTQENSVSKNSILLIQRFFERINVFDCVLHLGGNNNFGVDLFKSLEGSSGFNICHTTINCNNSHPGALRTTSRLEGDLDVNVYNTLVFNARSGFTSMRALHSVSISVPPWTGGHVFCNDAQATAVVGATGNFDNTVFRDTDTSGDVDGVNFVDISARNYRLVDPVNSTNLAISSSVEPPAGVVDPRIDITTDIEGKARPAIWANRSSGAFEIAGVVAANEYTSDSSITITTSTTIAGGVPAPAVGEWTEIANTDLRPLDPCPDNSCPYHSGTVRAFAGLMDSWNGGVFDSGRGQLVVWGGGHASTYGNYMYGFNKSTSSWSELIPTSNFAAIAAYQASGEYPDGKPLSRHTYDAMVYAESTQEFLSFGSSFLSPDGAASDSRLWKVDLSSGTPTFVQGTPCAFGVLLGFTAYNRVTDTVWYTSNSGGRLASYDVQTEVHTDHGSNYPIASDATAAIDTVRNRMLYIGGAGGGQAGWYDLNPATPTRTSLNSDSNWTSGPGNDLRTGAHHGIVYDDVGDRYVCWPDSGKTVYFVDPATFEVTTFTPAGGATPDAATGNGTYGRFNYDRTDNSLILVNSVDSNVFTLPLGGVVVQENDYSGVGRVQITTASTATGDPAAPIGQASWIARSTAPGVELATNFDIESDVLNWINQDGTADHMSWQQSGQTSGGGCLRTDILKTDAAGSGAWRRWMKTDKTEFVEGDEFWVSYRVYIPAYLATHEFLNGGGWKVSIISRHGGDMNGENLVGTNTGSNHTNEVVLNAAGYRGYPTAYSRTTSGAYNGIEFELPTACNGADITYQNMRDRGPQTGNGTACENDRARHGGLWSYGGGQPTDPLTNAKLWDQDAWQTFKFRIKVGSQGTSTNDSEITIWHASEGEDFVKIIEKLDVDLGLDYQDSVLQTFPSYHDTINLLTFDTNRMPDPTREDTYALYDEVIVSTQDIAAPLEAISSTYAATALVPLTTNTLVSGGALPATYTAAAGVPVSTLTTTSLGEPPVASNTFVTTKPSLIYDFEDAPASWVVGGTGTVAAGGLALTPNNKSIRLQSTVANNSPQRFDIVPSGGLDMTGTGSPDDLIHLRIAFEGGDLGETLGEGNGFRLAFTTGGFSTIAWTPTNFYRDSSGDRNQWEILSIKKSDFLVDGGSGADFTNADWANVTQISIYMDNNFSPFLKDITFDALYVGGDGTPALTMSFDDIPSSMQTVVLPDLDALGWKTSLFANRDSADGASNMTFAQLIAANANGHAVLNHTSGHQAFDVDGEAATIIGIDEGKAWTEANFNTIPVFAWTRGSYNSNLNSYIKSLGYLSARGAKEAGYAVPGLIEGAGHSCLFENEELPNQFETRIINLSETNTSSNTAAKILQLVDDSVALKQHVHLYGHSVVTGATVSTDFELAEWTALLAGLASREANGDFRYMAFHEFEEERFGPFAIAGGPVGVPASLGRGTLFRDSTVQGFSEKAATIVNPEASYVVIEAATGTVANEPLPEFAPGTQVTAERTATSLVLKWRLAGLTWQDFTSGGTYAIDSSTPLTVSIQ